MADKITIAELQQEVEVLKTTVETQGTIIEALEKALNGINAKLDGVASTVSSVSVGDQNKKEKPKDPGVVKVGDQGYKFKFLRFRMAKPGGGMITYTAEEAARDPEVLKTCLAAGILIPV